MNARLQRGHLPIPGRRLQFALAFPPVDRDRRATSAFAGNGGAEARGNHRARPEGREMIVILRNDITPEQREYLEKELKSYGVNLYPIIGTSRTVIALVGDTASIDEMHIQAIPGVAGTVRIQSKHKLVSLETQPEATQVEIAGKVKIGRGWIAVCAGPCSWEAGPGSRDRC